MTSAPTTIQEALGILLVPLNPETELDVYRGLQATLEAKAKAEAKGITHLQREIDDEQEQIRSLEHELDTLLRVSVAEQTKINEYISISSLRIPDVSIDTGDLLLPSLNKVSKFLESVKAQLTREISELEAEESALTSVISKKQEQLELIKRETNEINQTHDPLHDNAILRMNFYNTLGIKVENLHGKDKILTYNGHSASILDVEDNQTAYDISNQIWERL